MLIQFEIKNFAIIEHSLINFSEGFNVITGETGAGKSIILDALNALLGERTSKTMIRKGFEKAELKGVFLKNAKITKKLEELSIHIEDDYLILSRQLFLSGRSVVKLNGSIQTTQTIKELCQELIEICGQKDHLSLLKEERYLSMIDGIGHKLHQSLIVDYQKLYMVWSDSKKELERLSSNEREKEQLLDLYRFQKNEIDSLNLKVGEDVSLEDEEKFLASFDGIKTNVSHSLSALSSIDSIYDSKEFLKKASKYDGKLSLIEERIEKIYFELEDVQRDLESYHSSIEFDEFRLNEVVQRIDQIKQLKRKYADTIEGILSFRDGIALKLDEIENKDEKISFLTAEISKTERTLHQLAQQLHENRTLFAQDQQEKITEKLKELCMPDVTLHIVCSLESQFTPVGLTKVSILFNANKGEDLKPLSKTASGGELSRVLLALKMVQNSNDEVSCLIFDEVDEGIGGEVGRIIGEKLRELGKQVQVIAISHLPQVAAKGNHHFFISKSTTEERTFSTITKLTDSERIVEIAKMIYGKERNENTLKQAKDMLQY